MSLENNVARFLGLNKKRGLMAIKFGNFVFVTTPYTHWYWRVPMKDLYTPNVVKGQYRITTDELPKGFTKKLKKKLDKLSNVV